MNVLPLLKKDYKINIDDCIDHFSDFSMELYNEDSI